MITARAEARAVFYGEILRYNRGMMDFYKIDEGEMAVTTREVRRLMQERGWPAARACLVEDGWLVWATRPDGKEVRFRSAEPETTGDFAVRLAREKFLTYELLARIGVRHPETLRNPHLEAVEELLMWHDSLVVKPADGAHGNGVTVGVRDVGEAELALEKARHQSPSGEVLVQERLADGVEVRAICIDYKFVVALERVPAAVTGDGKHTVAELIEIENRELRTEAYRSRLAYIPKEAALNYLGDRAGAVPSAGEKVRVMAMCNIGQGGTTRDISTEWDAARRTEVERIAREFRLPVIGVDYLGDAVLEVNSCPSLYYNAEGPAATVAVEKYVEYLESI